MSILEKIKSIFTSKKEEFKTTIHTDWYKERNNNLFAQRNYLLIALILSIVTVIISVAVAAHLSLSRKFEPFVIQIDEDTGATTIINPLSTNILNGNDSIDEYFIKKYVIARETYNPVDFKSYARRLIRLYSTDEIYYQYLGYIRNKDNDPLIKYGDQNTTYLKSKSWSKLDKKKYVFRFSIHETTGKMLVSNKIAIIEIDYVVMELSDNDKDINPVGFQVRGYRVDEDNS